MATLENLLSQQMIERLGWTLIHFVWQAAAVALLLATLLRFLHKRSADARYIVSCLALSLIVALPLVTMLLVEASGPTAEEGPSSAPLPAAVATPVEVIELPLEPLDVQPSTMAAPVIRTPWTQRAAMAMELALPYVVLGWLLGVFGLAAWHLGGWAQLHRMKRRMIREAAAPLRAQLVALSERLGIHRAVGLLESALVEVPTVVGWIKPVILLPASALTGLDPGQLEAILAHELAHVGRHDYLVNVAQTVVEILGFYHPAVWWVSHRIRDERENCCDDVAVQVCGDSVRYARALTRLEEMRHCGTELAVAASGGSLVARVGRLLGRPTPNNRRFTWLPGLIALILVALIIIPTALVLAAPDQRAPESSVKQKDKKAAKDLAQILLETRIISVSDGKVLDHNSVASLRSILGSHLAESSPDAWHNIAARDFFVAQLADRALPTEIALAAADTLHRGKYVEVIDNTQMVAADGRPARTVLIGQSYHLLPPPPEVWTLIQKLRGVYAGVTLSITPRVIGKNNTTLQIVVEQNESEARVVVGDSEDSDRKAIQNHVVTLGDQCFSFRIPPPGEAQLPGSLFVMVTATIVRTNRDAAADEYSGQAHPRVVVVRKAQALDDAEQQDGDKVQIDFILAKALASATLDQETILLIGNALAAEYPKVTGEISDAASSKDVTLGEILQKYIAQRPLRAATVDTLMNLLQSRGYVEINAAPSVLTRDNVQALIKVGSEVPILPPGSPASAAEYVELGTTVQVTPHLSPLATDRITLEIGVKWTEWAEQAEADSNPAVRTTEVGSTVTTLKDRYFSLLVEPDSAESTPDTDSELMLIMFRADSVDPPAGSQPPSIAQAQQSNSHPRQVLLDVRTVAVEPSDLTALGIQWNSPSPSARGLPGDPWGLNIGYTPDRTITDSLLTGLDELCRQGRAQLISRQRAVALDGKQARVRALTEQWFAVHAPATANQSEPPAELVSVASGTVLSATPRIGDNNEITLYLATEYSRGIPPARSGELPVVTRRTTRNVVTLKDGGSAALAGLANSTREILILVTAQIAPENGQLPQPAETAPVPKPGSNGSRVPLVRVLAETEDSNASSEDEETQIKVQLVVIDVSADQSLTPETAARLSGLWDKMYVERKTEQEGRASLPSVEELQISPRELLERCTENAQGDSDALEILIDLLVSLEYVRVEMNPTIEVINGQSAKIESKQHVPAQQVTMPAGGVGEEPIPRTQKYYDIIDLIEITPHVDDVGRIALDVTAQVMDVVLSDGADEVTGTTKHSIDTRAVLDMDKTLVLRLESTTESEAQDNPVPYLLIRPRVIPPEREEPSTAVQDEKESSSS